MNPVPVVFAARDGERFSARDGGLRDIAPTLLVAPGSARARPDDRAHRCCSPGAPDAREPRLVRVRRGSGARSPRSLLWNWVWAVTLRGPVLYGEGAVAHAAILARDGAEYATRSIRARCEPIFVAANYPPLYFHLAGIGDDPFVTGRIAEHRRDAAASPARSRGARALPAGSLRARSRWRGSRSVPRHAWGAAVKPDLVALAFTVGAVLALTRARDPATSSPARSSASRC